ncbi:5-oxoprolinase subunit B family protein [Phycicoccus flavus]|uniref:Carboxyltransferase domain-containing protein n=1 Tax=Phycicoccus flavus TaxID=2502783 RepID=A0A8T6R9C5_9MICO|nr:carboxyltransferase domain-containing protein [Phycicoccus flavus]NHA70312.1 carboxyltransferase domain-containing protein [Phycicoccus flavus]
MDLLSYGDRAVLAELSDGDAAMALAAALRAAAPACVASVVPAARTVLVVAAEGSGVAEVRAVLAGLPTSASAMPDDDGGTLEVPVVYDGADLGDVAQLTGLTVDEVVAAHTGQTWRVAFGGFAPGFGYLVGEDDRLHVPRREESRTRVPAGSVGLAGEYSGVYPRESPGGWQLLGRTDLVLWDTGREPPALLRPGVTVRFVEAGR